MVEGKAIVSHNAFKGGKRTAWLALPIEEASKMQKPLPDDAIEIGA